MATVGFGVTMQRGTGSPLVYTDIAEVVGGTPPSVKKDTVERTHSKSPGKFREYMAGWRDGGEASIELQYDGADDLAPLVADVVSDDVLNYRWVFPDETHWDFTALAIEVSPAFEVDGRLVSTFTVKMTGKPDFVV